MADWEESLELAQETLKKLDDLPEAAEDFSISVEEKLKSMIEGIEEYSDVTEPVAQAIENMAAGVDRWLVGRD